MTNGKTIVHVIYNGQHYYFGSIAAIYDVLTSDMLHIGRDSLYSYGITPERPYRNAVCEIRRGVIYRHETKRKPPK